MTHYAVRDDLSFCRIGERFVFLDIDSDRYFRLPDSMERTLADYLDGNRTSTPEIRRLIERKILVDATGTATGSRKDIKPVTRSAMEAPHSTKEPRLSDLLEVLAIVLHTRVALKLLPIKVVLNGLVANQPTRPAQITLPAVLARQLSAASAVYRRARLYVPVDMCCLLDSIAMAKFLRRRKLRTHVVFGVALDPFSAHCWVQADDLVLNDSVGNVNSHTPIRVV